MHKLHQPVQFIINATRHELLARSADYIQFGFPNVLDYQRQIDRYLTDKIYNNVISNLMPMAIANALNVRIIIVDDIINKINQKTIIIPRPSVPDDKHIIVHLRTEHYSAINFNALKYLSASVNQQPISYTNIYAESQPSNGMCTLALVTSSITARTGPPSSTGTRSSALAISSSSISLSENMTTDNLTELIYLDDTVSDLSWLFTTSRGLSVVNCNVQGLLTARNHSKLDHLRDLLSPYNAPIFCMTESKLSKYVCDDEINVPGYTIYRRDRNENGGGVVIFCKNSLRSRQITDIECSLEVFTIKVNLSHVKAYVVCSAYRPPSSKALWLPAFNAYVSQLTILRGNCIITGDFNHDLLKSIAFSDELAESLGLKQHIKTAILVTTTSISLLDHVYTYNVSVHSKAVTEFHFADHFATCCVVAADIANKVVQRHITSQFWSFKNVDNDMLIADMQRVQLEDIECTSVFDTAIRFHSQFMNIWDQYAPLVNRRIRHKPSPWMTGEVLKAIYQRDAVYKYYLRLRTDVTYLNYKQHRSFTRKQI